MSKVLLRKSVFSLYSFNCTRERRKNLNTRYTTVLGSARTGLIFTRLQEGAQPGGLKPPGQTEQGIPYHVPSCWVPVGRSWAAGTHLQLRSLRWGSWRAALWVVQFVLYFLLICIVIVPVPFVYCSVKLPLSRPNGFCLFSFHSPPHPGGGRGGHVALLLAAAAKPDEEF